MKVLGVAYRMLALVLFARFPAWWVYLLSVSYVYVYGFEHIHVVRLSDKYFLKLDSRFSQLDHWPMHHWVWPYSYVCTWYHWRFCLFVVRHHIVYLLSWRYCFYRNLRPTVDIYGTVFSMPPTHAGLHSNRTYAGLTGTCWWSSIYSFFNKWDAWFK